MIPALLAAVLPAVAPDLVGWLAGLVAGDKTSAKATQITDELTRRVVDVLGTADPAAAATAIQDPAKLAELRKQVLDVQFAFYKADAEDRASARLQTVELARLGSRIAWGAPLISGLVLLVFGAVLYRVLIEPVPPGQDAIVFTMLGALTTMATAVVSYWVGSSAGSARKTDLLAPLGRPATDPDADGRTLTGIAWNGPPLPPRKPG